ncbi:MAG: hypothetical protein Q4A66_12040 [Eubacteriales bacterium]|nr:hypothetical protein [Eubacteriales bacterium]
MNKHRVLAVVGLVLIVASIVTMMVGMFAGAAKALLLNISMIGFLGAVIILLTISALRKREQESETKDGE